MRGAPDTFRDVVVASLGYAPDVIQPGKLHRFATSNRRGDASGWCRLFDDMRGGVYGCFRRGIGETWRADESDWLTVTQRTTLRQQQMAAAAKREIDQLVLRAKAGVRNAQEYEKCLTVTEGDPVALYLKRRGLANVWPVPPCIRLQSALPYWEDGKNLGCYPAMVAPVCSPDGTMVALHRTYLTTEGCKADVPIQKKLSFTSGKLDGASIRLFESDGDTLGVAEGIETALAATCASGVPTVAAYCAAALAGWQWPSAVRRVIVFADADEAGVKAARALQARALIAGLHCTVAAPSSPGSDWADVWAMRETVLEGGTL